MIKEDEVNNERTIHHPIEDVLGIEPGTTVMEAVEDMNFPMVVDPVYDDKDVEIENQFQDVYVEAKTTFTTLTDDLEVMDPRFRARTAEVAVQFLNTALLAAKEKLNQKQNKDKIAVDLSQVGPKTIHQNLNIIADRNQILRAMLEKEVK